MLPEATETLIDPAPRPYLWRAQQEKDRRRRPRIAFESAESEIEALFDACAPPSEAQVESQEPSHHTMDFDRRAILPYGFPLPRLFPLKSRGIRHFKIKIAVNAN